MSNGYRLFLVIIYIYSARQNWSVDYERKNKTYVNSKKEG